MALDRNQFEKPLRKLRKVLKKMRGEPASKQVHDLRTNSRRLEAMLQARDPDRNERKILKRVSRLRESAGKVRDMDVLTSYAAELTRSGDEEDCSVRLLEHLGATRRKKAKKLSKAVQESAPVLRKRLKRSSNQIQKNISRPNSGGSATSSHITAAALRLLSDLERPSTLNRSNLHPYRLKVKELQNLLRLAENAHDREFVESLGEVKDAIGEWHDWVELETIAKTVLDHPQCKLLQELKENGQERFTRALSIAENMRKKYVGVSKRTRDGGRKEPRKAESAWSATSALAA
jgi:CHAD domain-containing protein